VPAAARPGAAGVGSPERALSPRGTPAAGEAFEIFRVVPTTDSAPTCSVRRVPAAGGAAADVVIVDREDLVAALVDVCGAGWAFAPPAVVPRPAVPTGDAPPAPAGAEDHVAGGR
jgi:hypothetical protein